MKTTSTHERVSDSYAKAINKLKEEPISGSCCGGEDRFSAADLGYTDEGNAHPDAAGQSFGCGNPLAFAGVEAGQTVLDLGSGAGFDLLVARDKVGPDGHVIGVDMTDAMIATARRNVRVAGFNNVEVRKGLIENLPVESGTVDWVISNCVINLSPDKSAVFGEIARVLKIGGRFSISDIVAEELPDWLRNSAEAHSACIGGTIPEDEYVAGLRAAGMQADDVTKRIVYDRSQLLVLAGGSGLDGLTDLVSEEAIMETLDRIEGRIWSARFTGSKVEDTMPSDAMLSDTPPTAMEITLEVSTSSAGPTCC